jgi:hypothetical protein
MGPLDDIDALRGPVIEVMRDLFIRNLEGQVPTGIGDPEERPVLLIRQPGFAHARHDLGVHHLQRPCWTFNGRRLHREGEHPEGAPDADGTEREHGRIETETDIHRWNAGKGISHPDNPMLYALVRIFHTPSEEKEHTVSWGWGAPAPVPERNGARAPRPHEIFRLAGVKYSG